MPTRRNQNPSMRTSSSPTIGLTMGDPGGIGPEVLVAALAARPRDEAPRYVIYASGGAMHEASDTLGVEPFWWRLEAGSSLRDVATSHRFVLLDYDGAFPPPSVPARAPTPQGGALSLQLVEDAIADASRPAGDPARIDAIVTGPISKQAWSLSGKGRWPGHTELLAARFGAKRVGMMFVGPRLKVVLATAHVPLMDVRNVLTIGRVFDAIDMGAEACRALGIARPRIAVCGLNPHAGEGGLLGDEETRLIEPAIEHAVRTGIDASGPFPADTIFNAAVGGGRYDLVVAMYHDQGLIPVKLLARDESVNVTLGLPIARTSPDHGTAFDIAGRGVADPGSTIAAIDLAVRMATSSAATSHARGA
ncbi:MAG: 4-hydroxythreonine-4-phosphate dehydrogenase PdxA [Phycisphaerales bacterium]